MFSLVLFSYSLPLQFIGILANQLNCKSVGNISGINGATQAKQIEKDSVREPSVRWECFDSPRKCRSKGKSFESGQIKQQTAANQGE